MAFYKTNIKHSAEFTLLAQHYFLLAYQECGTEIEMECLQARTNISVENVLKYCNKKKYNGFINYHGNYIAGRMAKLGIEFDVKSSSVIVPSGKPRPDYQAWSTGQFKTFDALLQQAAKNADIELILVQS